MEHEIIDDLPAGARDVFARPVTSPIRIRIHAGPQPDAALISHCGPYRRKHVERSADSSSM